MVRTSNCYGFCSWPMVSIFHLRTLQIIEKTARMFQCALIALRLMLFTFIKALKHPHFICFSLGKAWPMGPARKYFVQRFLRDLLVWRKWEQSN